MSRPRPPPHPSRAAPTSAAPTGAAPTRAPAAPTHPQVKVKRRGSDAKHVATVLAVGAECDIALLAVEDAEFWVGLTAVRFGTLPRLQDAVTVIG